MKALALLLILGLAAPAQAQFFGTVTGTIRAVDGRADPYASYDVPVSGARQTIGGTQALEEILVRVLVISPSGAVNFWTRTDASGRYSVPWTSPGPAAALRVEVRAMRPRLGSGEVVRASDQPSFQFRITTTGVSNVVLGSRTITPDGNGAEQNAGFAFGTSEVIDAYLTAREVYAMFDAQSDPPGGSIRGDMNGLNIFANASVVAGVVGGIAPSATEVLLIPGTAGSAPFTVAHEIGHIVEYRSLDVALSPVLPADYERDAPFVTGAWSDFSNEFERAAFQEGFAHAVGGMWMWVRSASPSPAPPGFPRGGGLVSLEPSAPAVGTTPPCAMDVPVVPGQPPVRVTMGHRRAACIARALWDILDRPAGDDDPIANRDLGDLVQVLRAYPRGCLPLLDNGCVGEHGQDDGMNWSDFRRNHELTFPESLGGIETANLLQRSDRS